MADEDFDVLAAEYALGTLTAEERDNAEQMMARDAGFAARVAAWERRLGPLEAMVEPVEPPAELWDAIRSRVAKAEPGAAMRLPEVAVVAPVRAAGAGTVAALSQAVRRWRALAGIAAAVAAVLLIVGVLERSAPDLLPAQWRRPVQTKIVEKEVEKIVEKVVEKEVAQPAPGRSVAVLKRDPDAPAFLLTVDVAKRMLMVRRVAPPEPGKSHELWLISDKLPGPRSLGVLGPEQFIQREVLGAYDAETINGAIFAVSLEPEGGSPTGAPTGPLQFTGSLLDVVPPRP